MEYSIDVNSRRLRRRYREDVEEECTDVGCATRELGVVHGACGARWRGGQPT
ncbi:hypothetical protein E1A91_A13G198900v1 [Gossypium mustelinum]|uniref:Uncharacterized protein n=2 Tax=Gossypium TaxID=3633 RepID=A0A5D2WKI0_GOSMU|nr:hypothetical protein ES332_A13G208300v1 [Gossypium tomentosum]TYJ02057.1 hypothetical protein E1A91_A13G198900v1 [Gossypium mustelinum]